MFCFQPTTPWLQVYSCHVLTILLFLVHVYNHLNQYTIDTIDFSCVTYNINLIFNGTCLVVPN